MASACALAIFSGKIFLIRVCRGLRAAPNAAFTSGVVTGNSRCTLYRPRSLRQRASPLSFAPLSSSPKGRALGSPRNVSSSSAKCVVSPEPLPLGEVDANAVSRRRGLARSPQRGCFRRKPALQMPLASTTPPVKMQCRTARRLPGIALLK